MDIFVVGTRGIPGIQGGVEKHCEELYGYLSRYPNLNITVLARKRYFPRENRTENVKGIWIKYFWAPKSPGLEAFIHSFVASLYCILKRPSIVHFHNMGPAFFISLVKLFGIPCVFTYHSINYEHRKWGGIARAVLKAGEFMGMRFAAEIVVVSKATKRFLETKYPHRSFRYIPNGIRPQACMPAGDVLNRYGLTPKGYVFTACRIAPEKGTKDLIEAFLKVPAPAFKLVIAGKSDHETLYSSSVKELATCSADIILTGEISGNVLTEIFSNAGLFVLPSYNEGLPMALLEALNFGLPVLVSDIPQNRDFALSSFRYFPLGKIEALSHKMSELFRYGITDGEKADYQRLLLEFDWETVSKRTWELYRSVSSES